MKPETLDELYSYAVTVRRKLHQIPEVGFDLPRTTELLQAELEAMGIHASTRYGECSLSADLGQGQEIIALRADMDALPVAEESGLPFASCIPGNMHACGHDTHMAILLAVARYLKAHESELPCRIRLIFQPNEEGAQSGARMMVENGVLDGVSHILCTHCENSMDPGTVGVCPGDYMAACFPFIIRFKGTSAHATMPELGVDAIAMAVEAYGRLKKMVAEEAGENTRYIWSVGRIDGGTAHNVISDHCEMEISFRLYDMAFAKRVELRAAEICRQVAEEFGGGWEWDWHMSTGPVHNDAAIVDRFRSAAEENGITVLPLKQRMASEDYGWYCTRVPAMLFLYGSGHDRCPGGRAPLHRNDFNVDELGMRTAIEAFIGYVFAK